MADPRTDLGVRAEATEVRAGSSRHDARELRCTLEVFEPLGSSVLLTTESSGRRLKIQAPATFQADPGQQLHITLPEAQCRWYDPTTKLLLETA